VGVKTTRYAYGGQSVVIGEHGEFWREREWVFAGIPDRERGGCRCRQDQHVDISKSQRYGFPVLFDLADADAEVHQRRREIVHRVTEAPDSRHGAIKRRRYNVVRSAIAAYANAKLFVAPEVSTPCRWFAVVAALSERLENESRIVNTAGRKTGMRHPSDRLIRGMFPFKDACHVDHPVRTLVAHNAATRSRQPA